MTIPTLLQQKLTNALSQVLGATLPKDFKGLVTPSADLRFGDYQSNAAMMLAKRVKTNPRALAQQVVDAIGNDDVCSMEIAGPGFINFRINPGFFAVGVGEMLGDARLGVPFTESPKSIVIDFSAPNVAKPMHVGHIRSTIIGDSLARVARFVGHKVITDNHIGDWGTQFGMILWGWKNILDMSALEQNPIDELLRVYKDVNVQCKENPDLLPICKAELVKLQGGDEENLGIWKRCVDVSKSGLQKIYDRLDIHFDFWLGESHYNDALAPLVDEMIEKGMARESEGAICVFSDGSLPAQEDPFLVQEKGEWRANPCIVRKADGGFLYATTDLATLDFRTKNWDADSIWYVVGAPQALHFRQIFDVERRRGVTGDFRHIAFGSILGDDRRPFKTRSGETVSLQDVLDEAVERAGKVVEEKSPDMPQEEKARVASIVGIGAVKFAELSQNRMTDYVFNWDKMLALQGDTAPYLQNSYVRVKSIFRKVEGEAQDWSLPLVLSDDAEIHLSRLLVRYGEVVPLVLDDCRPNILASYIFDLARAFHSFYEACPVLKSAGDVRRSRLALCELTSRVLKHGLGLMGIDVPDRM
ncbi:MAG: arginine--tRNA ligase [Akkermansia sp.]